MSDPFGLGLGWAAASFAGGGGAGAQTLSVSIAASADDAQEVIATTACAIVGQNFSFATANLQGLRYLVPTLPQGADVAGAAAAGALSQIQFTASGSSSNSAVMRIWCQAADAGALFTTTNADISSRALTTEFVDWTVPAWTSGDRTAAQLTPDLSSIIQPVVDRAGFNGVLVFVTHMQSGSRTGAALDHTTLQEATLVTRFAA